MTPAWCHRFPPLVGHIRQTPFAASQKECSLFMESENAVPQSPEFKSHREFKFHRLFRELPDFG
eukprot:7493794-Alexandrium_andersonii.AAC.1